MMASLYAPSAIIEPTVIEVFGIPEIYCNGSFARYGLEVVEVVLFVERRAGETVERHQCGLIRMPRTDYEAAVRNAGARLKGMARH